MIWPVLGTRKQYHYGPDGKVEAVWIYHNGHLVEMRRDQNHDGRWDHWTHYDHGSVTSAESDNNFDGKVDEWWVYTNNVVAELEKDSDFNGIPDEFCTYKDGVIQQVDIRPNGAKFSTTRELFRNGVLVEILRGGDSNGAFREDVFYDPFFNPIRTNKLQ